ncbi:MAG TPA: hypothetical protein VHW91_07040 [Candidatus Dormibacteraeota bacterium]|nr:hypothetical protein [Candidatus Dormibacteraeota bacterium]
MDRLTWLALALVLLLGGLYLHLHQVADWLTSLTAGVGAGIALALTGSIIHDALSNSPPRP